MTSSFDVTFHSIMSEMRSYDDMVGSQSAIFRVCANISENYFTYMGQCQHTPPFYELNYQANLL